MEGFIGRFADWWRQPFRPDMTAFDWFLFWGLVGVSAAAWAFIINRTVD